MRIRIILASLPLLAALAAGRAHSQTLSLEQVIREVCTNSDSVKMMRETVIKSDETVRQNWSAALPKVSATVFAGRGRQGLGGGGGSSAATSAPALGKTVHTDTLSRQDSSTVKQIAGQTLGQALSNFDASTFTDLTPFPIQAYSASISVTQPLFTFGKIGTAIQVASQFNKSVKSNYHRNLEQLQLLAVDAFYRVVLAEMAADVTKRSMARKKELYEFLDRNFKLGSGSRAQILATLADLRGLEPMIIKAEQDRLTANMGLNMLMGRPLTDPLQLDTAAALPGLAGLAVPPEKEAVQKALEQREDLHSLDYLAQATMGGKRIYNAMYLPSIAATGSFGTGGTKPEYLTEWDRRNWMVGLAMQWTLFDGFASNAKARQYASDAHKLEAARNTVSKLIEIEVITASLECAAADSNWLATAEMLGAARESYSLTSDNFKQGSGQFADLQLAEDRLRQSELGSVSARYRVVRSRAALQIALGQDLVTIKSEDK